MDLCFTGGEIIRLRDGWHLEVLHVRGTRTAIWRYTIRSTRRPLWATPFMAAVARTPPRHGHPVTYYYIDITFPRSATLALAHRHANTPALADDAAGKRFRDFIASRDRRWNYWSASS